MKPTVTLFFDEFELGGPAQQILDRVLLGWVVDGEVQEPPGWEVRVGFVGPEMPFALQERQQRFGLKIFTAIDAAVSGATATMVIARGIPSLKLATAVEQVLRTCAEKSALAFHGPWGTTPEMAALVASTVRQKRLRIWTTHADAFLVPLPATEVFLSGQAFKEGLLLAPNTGDSALNDALGAWLPRISRRPGAESAELALRRVRCWLGTGAWQSRAEWPGDLFAAAVSRSDNPQGDSDRESRVQDLVGLGLAPGLAQQLEVWQLEHADGFRSTIVLQTGLIKDVCLAARTRAGRIISGQLFRPGTPQLRQYDGLVEQWTRLVVPGGTAGGPDIGPAWTRLTAALAAAPLRAGSWRAL